MLIDKIEMDFGLGLCVLTGETGAGKSMILESLELLSGRRVKTNLRSDNGQKTVITALVEISKYIFYLLSEENTFRSEFKY